MGSYFTGRLHWVRIKGRRHGSASRGSIRGRRHGPAPRAATGPHHGPTPRVRITRQHQGPASRTRVTGRHGSAPRADATGPHHGPTSRVRITRRHQGPASRFESPASVTGSHHEPAAPGVGTMDRQHGSASRTGITGIMLPGQPHPSRSHRYLRAGAEATEAGTGAGDRASCRNVVSNQPLQSSNSYSSPPSVDPAWWHQYRLL